MRLSLVIALATLIWSESVLASTNVAPEPLDDCKAGFQSMEKDKYTDGVDLLSKCLKRNLPISARAYVLRTRAEGYRELKRPDLAVEDAKTALRLEKPKDVWPLVSLGYYYRDLKKYDLALAALREALKYDEDGPGTGPGMAVYYHTGWTLHVAGRYAEAIEAYTKGIPKQEDYGYAFYRRALSYEALGNREQAKRDLFRALELTPKEGYEKDVEAKFIEYGFTPKKQAN